MSCRWRRCSSLSSNRSPSPERHARFALVRDTLRAHRVATAVWVIGGSGAMYLMAVAIAHEMERFPGGTTALVESVLPGVEAMRPLRWPAERLDTLGGYLTYHNLTLYTLFLSLYAGVQGARAVRGGEDLRSLEQILATGWSRSAVVRDRTLGFLGSLLLVTLGVGLGVAAAMAGGGEPDLAGSLVTVGSSGLAAMVAYALGLLLAQLTATTRVAAGASAIVITGLYVGTNLWEKLGLLGLVRFVSPFYYANFSRALVPGHGLDLATSGVLVALTAVLLWLAARAFERRDYGAALWSRRRRPHAARAARVQRPMLRSVWSAGLLRGRLSLLAWVVSAAAFAALMGSLQPAVMRAWSAFEAYGRVAGGGAGISPAAQYMSLAGELVAPVLAAYVVAQSSGWVADLAQGRVEMVLAAPVSWSRLVWERILTVIVGSAAITAGALGGLLAGGAAGAAELDAAGVARLALDLLLLGAALAGVAAVVVAVARTGVAVTVLAVLVSAWYLLFLVIPLYGWPDWVNRLSIFGAFGHPYLGWPPVDGVLVLLALAIAGGVLAAWWSEHTPKVA